MEDLDVMIMDTLRKLDCSFCADVDALSLMGQADIVEAVVKLLWACDPDNQQRIPSYKLPHTMTVRYKAATTIANATKELGIREEVGYQTLLYPNIYEIRQILISLIEKLPKKTIATDDNRSPLDRLKAQIGEQIREDLGKKNYPCHCRDLVRTSDARKWHLKAHHPGTFNFSTSSASNDFRGRICLAMEGHPINSNFPTDQLTFKQTMSMTAKRPRNLSKPALPPKPKPRTFKEEKAASKSIDDELNLEKVREHNSTLRSEVETRSEQAKEVRSLLRSLEAEFNQHNMELQSKDEKLLQILRDPEAQFQSLNNFIDQAPARRRKLENTLAEWKAENLPELERLRKEAGHHALSNAQQQEAQRAIEQLKRSISDQTHVLQKLQKQVNKEKASEMDTSERTKFLSRIMYLVKNVNAQKEEVLKSFQACQQLEKERQQLTGNLDRTFTVVNSWLGANSENDATLRKAHSSLVKMHNHSEMIRQSIDTIFTLNQTADEFQDQRELLAQQQIDSNLDQILEDLQRVREENDEIRTRLDQRR